MTREEWQKLYGFTDADVHKIDSILKLFGGKIVAILDIKICLT